MDNELWLGSLSLYQSLLSQQEAVSAAMLAGSFAENENQDPPEHFTLFGNVAVIDVTGTLTNDDSWWNSFIGNTSYNAIRRALIEAATHSDVKAIVMNIDSGGGTPNGLADVGDMVRQITAAGIPVHSYSGGIMASAAYWLGSAGVKVHAGETADIGSIGVISIHKEYTDMFKKDGVKVTVFRAGDEKALSNPYEKLSDKAKESIQSQLDALYDVFINRVAEYRGVSPQFVREHMADGREFIGQQALDAGLVDDITTLDDLITGLQSKIDKTAGKETSMAKQSTRVLTQAQRDAMMEGASTEAALAIAPAEGEVLEDPAQDEAELATETEVALETTPSPAHETELVTFLRAELAAKTQEVVNLNTQLNSANTEVANLKAVHDPLKKLVATSISRMQVGLGAPMMDMSDMPAEVILAQHAKVTEVFCKKFPVGGIAAITAEEDTALSTLKPKSSPGEAARLRQAKI